jgi:signal transduction histidine kinase
LLTCPTPRLVFLSAIFLLVLCGAGSVWALYRAYSGEKWVRHTYDVQVLTGEIESNLGKAGRARQLYLQTGDEQNLQEIARTRTELITEIGELKALVQDSPDQEDASRRLEQTLYGRFRTVDESIQLAKSGKSTSEAQDQYLTQLVIWSQQTSTVADEIRDAESRLLRRRLSFTNASFTWIVDTFAATFFLSLYMLWEHYQGLNRELAHREMAERSAQRLSAQLLKAQDLERRKIARDLHDGLGQTLAAGKMIADSFTNRAPEKQEIHDLSAILDEAVSSTRSISHLLHPPLVDEIGFIAAARSYLEGFSRRTGVGVTSDLPDNEDRLPRDLELTLFRVLQEALANIQRHSKSTKVDVHFEADPNSTTLSIRDNGVGIPSEVIKTFLDDGAHVGVGLAGMRERVRERNGHFDLSSDSSGTLISATFPANHSGPPDTKRNPH